MTRRRYDTKEAWNRILRAFRGYPEPTDEPGSLSGEVLSENQAISDFAELIVGSLPGESGELPNGISVPGSSVPSSTTTAEGIIETATNAEAVAGTDTERAVTPAGVAASIAANVGTNVQYGEIYNNSTGTASLTLSTSWAKITGSFQADGLSSANIVPDWNDDRITINEVGTYFVGMQLSFEGGANAIIESAIYLDGVRQEGIRFRRKLSSVGDVGSASALGIISVTGTGMDLEIYVRAEAGTPAFSLQAGQLWTYGLP